MGLKSLISSRFVRAVRKSESPQRPWNLGILSNLVNAGCVCSKTWTSYPSLHAEYQNPRMFFQYSMLILSFVLFSRRIFFSNFQSYLIMILENKKYSFCDEYFLIYFLSWLELVYLFFQFVHLFF